jgi:hypothetical protein
MSDLLPDVEGLRGQPLIKRLARWRKACERWKSLHYNAVASWKDARVKEGAEPTADSCRPEKCEPKDFGLDGPLEAWAEKIRKEVFKE